MRLQWCGLPKAEESARRRKSAKEDAKDISVFSALFFAPLRLCESLNSETPMDAHTLELLEFAKVRELLAAYASSSLGKDLATQLEPSTDTESIRLNLALVTEMAEAIGEGRTPPFGGLHDVRLLVRRAAIGSMLAAEQLLEVADTLTCTGNMYRYRMRLDARFQRLIALLAPIEDLGLVAKSITGCIDNRGQVLDMASRGAGPRSQASRRRG